MDRFLRIETCSRWLLPTPQREETPGAASIAYSPAMHFDAHQPIFDDLEARITTIRDSL